MIIDRLRLRNFKSYRELDIAIPTEGLIGVVGANGTGKSTIFEAILFALYGKFPLDKDLLRHAGAGEKEAVEVELAFIVRGKDYRVLRELRGKALAHKAELRDEAGAVLATQDKPVREEVSKLLGLDETAFSRSVFARQKELAVLSSDQAEVRKANVRRMLGLEKIDEAYKAALKEQSALASEIRGMEHTLLTDAEAEEIGAKIAAAKETEKALQGEIAQAQAAAEKAKRDYDAAEAERALGEKRKDERARVEKALEGANQTARALAERIEHLRDEAAALAEKKETLAALQPDEEAFHTATKARNELLALRENFNRRQRLIDKYETKKTEAEQLRGEEKRRCEELTKLGDTREAEQTAQKKMKQSQATVKELRTQKQQATDEAAAIGERIHDRENKARLIEHLGPEADCPTCGRPLADDYHRVLAQMAEELAALQEKERKTAQAKLEDIGERLHEAEQAERKANDELAQAKSNSKQAETFNAELALVQKKQAANAQESADLERDIAAFGEAAFEPQELAEAERREGQLQPKHKQFVELSTELKRIPDVEEELADKQTKAEANEKEIGDLKARLVALPFDAEQYAKLVEHRNELSAAKDEASRQLAELEKQRLEIANESKTLCKRLEDDDKLRHVIAAKREKADDHAACAEALRSFKTAVLAHVTPLIDRLAGQMFAEVTRGRYAGIRIDEEFDFLIADEGCEYPIRRFSGGEVDLANLCLRVAIGKTVAQLNGQTAPGLLAFDEIFGSQDDDRRAHLLEALNLLKGQVLVISHMDAVKDDFAHALLVRRDAGGSRAAWLGQSF